MYFKNFNMTLRLNTMTKRPAPDSDKPIGSGPLSRSRALGHPCCDTGSGLIPRTI
jgi:hypothetical protein